MQTQNVSAAKEPIIQALVAAIRAETTPELCVSLVSRAVTDKVAKKIFEAGLSLATRGADEETQELNDSTLSKAEERFTLLIEDMAPNYCYGYTNRANVRVARGNYQGALEDYNQALQLAPLASDAWVTYLNRGSTFNRLGRQSEALMDFERAVTLSKGDRFTLLGRGGVYHALGRYGEAADDLLGALDKAPATPEPFWLRLSQDLFEVGRRQEALGYARRTAAKFDIEPETNLAVCSMLWRDGPPPDRDEAMRRYKVLPVPTREKMETVDLESRGWPPKAQKAAAEFLAEAKATMPAAAKASPPQAPAAAPTPSSPPAAEATTGSAMPVKPADSVSAAQEEIARLQEELAKLKSQGAGSTS